MLSRGLRLVVARRDCARRRPLLGRNDIRIECRQNEALHFEASTNAAFRCGIRWAINETNRETQGGTKDSERRVVQNGQHSGRMAVEYAIDFTLGACICRFGRRFLLAAHVLTMRSRRSLSATPNSSK